MFGLSVWEIFILLVVTLLIVGPERMPALARSAGEWVVKIRRFVANARAEMDSEFNTQDLKKLLNSQEQELESLRQLVEDSRRDVADSGRTMLRAIDEARTDAEDAGSDVSGRLSEALNSLEAGVKTEQAREERAPASAGEKPEGERATGKEAGQAASSADVASGARADRPAEPPAPGSRDDDDYDALLEQANERFARPFAPPEPVQRTDQEQQPDDKAR
ncbi:MAG: Sec-independent protein translocase protein TatB [Halothiobacillaceae bacterium]